MLSRITSVLRHSGAQLDYRQKISDQDLNQTSSAAQTWTWSELWSLRRSSDFSSVPWCFLVKINFKMFFFFHFCSSGSHIRSEEQEEVWLSLWTVLILVFISRLQVQQGNRGVGTKPRSDLKDVLRDKERVCSAETRGLCRNCRVCLGLFVFSCFYSPIGASGCCKSV